MDTDNKALKAMIVALQELRQAKPEDRGELARRYAVTITELEKVLAYFETFVINREYESDGG